MYDNLRAAAAEDFIPYRYLEKNYRVCTTCTTHGDYDYLSIMHYKSIYGSQNRTVLRPKDGVHSPDELGQREGLSILDAEDINKYFECGKYLVLILLCEEENI